MVGHEGVEGEWLREVRSLLRHSQDRVDIGAFGSGSPWASGADAGCGGSRIEDEDEAEGVDERG